MQKNWYLVNIACTFFFRPSTAQGHCVWRLQIWRKIEFASSPFSITSQTAQPIRPSKAGSAGTVLLATLKGLGENSFFLQICNLYAIQIHISSCSLLLQFARVLIRLWAPVFGLCKQQFLEKEWKWSHKSKNSCPSFGTEFPKTGHSGI